MEQPAGLKRLTVNLYLDLPGQVSTVRITRERDLLITACFSIRIAPIPYIKVF